MTAKQPAKSVGRPRKVDQEHAAALMSGSIIQQIIYKDVMTGKTVHVPPAVVIAAEMVARGRTNEEIASTLRVSPATVGRWRKQYISYIEQQVIVKATIEDMLDPLVPKAVRTMSEILDSPDVDPSTKQRTAADILDRKGGKPTQKIVTDEHKEYKLIYEIIETPTRQIEQPVIEVIGKEV